MTTGNHRNRLTSLLPFSRCAVILVVSFHVINQRVYFSGFSGRDILNEGGWTPPSIVITLLCLMYFFSAVADLVIEKNGTVEGKDQHLLKTNLTLQGFLVFLLFVFSPESAGVFAILCLSRVRCHYSLKSSLLVLSVTILVFMASVTFYYGASLGVLGIGIVTIMASGFYIFTLIHSHNAVREKELRHEAVLLNKELSETRELLAQSTRQRERLRISRNIHDVLGHKLTGLILNLEVASHLTEGEVQTKVEKSLTLAKSLLQDLREAVTEIRESAFLDFNQAVQKIINNIPQLDIHLAMEEGIVIGNAETTETLIRFIQEALTNVIRHANATHCSISMFRDKGKIVLQIEDNGSNRGEIFPGNGLNGMLERITALSGKMSWSSQPGGFFIEALLPLEVI